MIVNFLTEEQDTSFQGIVIDLETSVYNDCLVKFFEFVAENPDAISDDEKKDFATAYFNFLHATYGVCAALSELKSFEFEVEKTDNNDERGENDEVEEVESSEAD